MPINMIGTKSLPCHPIKRNRFAVNRAGGDFAIGEHVGS